MRDALPIRCLEAVFLALHLTQGMQELDRFPVSFKSTVAGQVYRHIVLAIRVNGKFGAMGLSRRNTLMFKDFTYPTFGDLIVNFRDAYEECFHRLLTVNTGLPISHNDYRATPIVRSLWLCGVNQCTGVSNLCCAVLAMPQSEAIQTRVAGTAPLSSCTRKFHRGFPFSELT